MLMPEQSPLPHGSSNHLPLGSQSSPVTARTTIQPWSDAEVGWSAQAANKDSGPNIHAKTVYVTSTDRGFHEPTPRD
jgi:hypothetical protein